MTTAYENAEKGEREKQWDELFNEIKPVTLPKQEWKQKETPEARRPS
jgi:hypothetical protein